jgi:hypothetical protein
VHKIDPSKLKMVLTTDNLEDFPMARIAAIIAILVLMGMATVAIAAQSNAATR